LKKHGEFIRREYPRLFASIFHTDAKQQVKNGAAAVIQANVDMPLPSMDELNKCGAVHKEAPRKARWADLLQTFELGVHRGSSLC